MALALLYLWSPSLPWLRDGAVYVSPDGSDWSTGRSPESAVATIQRAADMVAPGESVVVLPGVYRETVRVRRGGEPGRPVTFRAETPGTVTITGAAPDSVVEALEWRDEGGSIWSARSPWPVYHVVVDGSNLYHVRWGDSRKREGKRGKADVLHEVAAREGAWPAFTHERGRLYVALPDGRPPRERAVAIHRRIPPPYASWTIRSANVWVEADHVVFEGLRFELGVGTGLLLWSARDVTVRDCLFSGAMTGVRAFPRVRRPDGLVVERSMYHNHPQAHWLDGWLGWREVYRHHSYSSLVSLVAENVRIRHNLIAHAGDGLQVTTPGGEMTGGIEIYGNLLFRGTDDAIELDGHAQRVLIRWNIVYDSYVGLGLSPVLTGPVLVDRNLFLGPEGGLTASHLKLLNPWRGESGVRGGPIRNVVVTRNVFVGGAAAWSRPVIEDVVVRSNVFAVGSPGTRWSWGVTVSENEWSTLGNGYGNPARDCTWAERLPVGGDEPPPRFREIGGSEAKMRPRPGDRPGPRWLDYGTLAPSAEVVEKLSAELIEWRCG